MNRPPADPRNVVSLALADLEEGNVNPARSEVHSPNVMAQHVKELGRFFGADQVGIVELAADPFGAGDGADGPGRSFAIIFLHKADADTRAALGAGGQAPTVKGLFATFNMGAYIREIGYRANRSKSLDGERLAARAGLGTLDVDGRLVSSRFGRGVHVAEVVVTELPLEPDAREAAA
jgi:hypothetical protein